MLLFCSICLGQSNIKFYYQDKTKATETDSIGYKYYIENTPKEFQKKEDEVLLFFNNAAFIDELIMIN